MLCEECKVKEASYTISVRLENKVRLRHLCNDCMQRMNQSVASGNIRGLLSSLLSSGSAPQERAQEQTHEQAQEQECGPRTVEVTCQRCLMTWSQFKRSGRLGCPGCYEAFWEKLQPTLLQIHGRRQHAGRQPLCNEADQRARSQQEELTRQMEQAVALEDFETAAVLRDRIRELVRKGDAQ